MSTHFGELYSNSEKIIFKKILTYRETFFNRKKRFIFVNYIVSAGYFTKAPHRALENKAHASEAQARRR